MEERCDVCGASFTCLADSGEGNCWCDAVEVPPQALEQARELSERCLCPRCLTALPGAPALRVTRWPR